VLVSSGMFAHTVALLGGRGVPASQAVTFVTLAAAGMGVVRLFEGFLLDAINSPKLGIPFVLLSLLGLILLQNGDSTSSYMIAGLLFGMGVGGETSLIPYALSRFFGIGALAQIYGMGWACAAVAAGIGPVLMGFVYDRTGSYNSALLLAEALMGVVVLCFVLMPAYRFPARIAPAATPDRALTPSAS
jgi:MFS family permease